MPWDEVQTLKSAIDRKLHAAMLQEVTTAIDWTIASAITGLTAGYMVLYRLTAAAAINEGLCHNFATDLVQLLGFGQVVWSSDPEFHGSWEDTGGDHAFVWHQGRCYDAECPGGVENYADLPFFNRNPLP